MHKSQVFGYLLISFLAGVFIGKWFENVQLTKLVFILVGTILVVVCGYEKTFVKSRRAAQNRQIGVVTGLCILAVALGVFRYGQANLNHSVLTLFADREASGKGVPVILRGYVDDEMIISNRPSIGGQANAQIIFHVTELEVPDRIIETDERTLLSVKSYQIYQIGDKLSVVGALRLPDNFTPDFDYVQYLKNKDIRTTVSYPKIAFDDSVYISTYRNIKISIYRRLFIVKDHFQFAVSRALSEPYAAYINGILLGTRQNIPPDITEAFNRTSTTHVLAISGYNITIIAWAILSVLILWMRRKRAFWLSIAIIILFTLLTGAGASVVRAAIMGLLLLFANGYGRLYDPQNSILFAAAVMVFMDPLSLRFDVGFQLSFLAVLGLVYLYPILENKVNSRFEKVPIAKRSRILDFTTKLCLGEIGKTFLMSLSAQIMVAPLLAYQFHTFSLVSLLANVLILPLMSYTILFGFLTGVGSLLIAPLGQAVGLIALALGWYQLQVIQWLGSWSFAAVKITISTWTLTVAYFIISWLVWKNHVSKYFKQS